MYERIVRGRRARDHREQRRLARRQRARRLAEIQPRRGVEPVRAVAEVRAVQPLLEDRALVEGALEAKREHGLAQLVRDRARVLGAEHHARELHRQRRAAESAAARIEPRRARDADPVDAVVIPEVFVLGFDHRGHRDRRQIVERDPVRAVGAVRGQRRDLVAVNVDAARAARAPATRRGDRTETRRPARARAGSPRRSGAAPRSPRCAGAEPSHASRDRRAVGAAVHIGRVHRLDRRGHRDERAGDRRARRRTRARSCPAGIMSVNQRALSSRASW